MKQNEELQSLQETKQSSIDWDDRVVGGVTQLFMLVVTAGLVLVLVITYQLVFRCQHM